MRISDWSSDVCSSDLGLEPVQALAVLAPEPFRIRNRLFVELEIGRLVAPGALRQLGGHGKYRIVRHGPTALPHLSFPERGGRCPRSEEHTSELQSLMRNSYAVFCLKKKNITRTPTT